MSSINKSEPSLPREVVISSVVSREVIESLADNGYCPEHDAEIRRQVGDELLKRINDKEYGIEKNNLWLISQINNICYGVPRICDLIEKEQMNGVQENECNDCLYHSRVLGIDWCDIGAIDVDARKDLRCEKYEKKKAEGGAK